MAYDGDFFDNDGRRPPVAANQAKYLSEAEYARAVKACKRHPIHPLRNLAALQLSYLAGLRAVEIARLEWARHLCTASGRIADEISITDDIAKGGGRQSRSGRPVPMNDELAQTLRALRAERPLDKYVFHASAKVGPCRQRLTPAAVHKFFERLYEDVGLEGASSHSGRRTFITDRARIAPLTGCSIRDVQKWAGHTKLSTTQKYIEPASTGAQRKLINLTPRQVEHLLAAVG